MLVVEHGLLKHKSSIPLFVRLVVECKEASYGGSCALRRNGLVCGALVRNGDCVCVWWLLFAMGICVCVVVGSCYNPLPVAGK